MSRIDEVMERSQNDESLLEELDQPGVKEELTSLLPE